MADKLTPKDLQQMKAEGKKIAAAVVYDATMTEICEAAGVDLLSIGDSVGRTYLGQDEPDDYTVEEMMVFARAVGRTAKRAVVSVDMNPPSLNPNTLAAVLLAFAHLSRRSRCCTSSGSMT